MIRNFLFLLFDAPDTGSGGDASEIEQDLADLGDDTETTDKGEDADESDADESAGGDDDADGGDEEEAESEEEDEEKEEEEEDEDDKEKKDEDEVERDAGGRPTVKAIKAVYPELFKRFPELKRAYFMVGEYDKIFADPSEAQAVVSKAQEFDEMESELVGQSDPTGLVKTLLENNPKALKRMLSNLPEVVRKIAPDEYIALTRPIIEELLYFAAEAGKKKGGKEGNNIHLAARHLANWVFGNGGEIPEPSGRGKAEPSEAEVELAKERSQNRAEKLNNAAKRAMDEAEPVINGLVMSKLKGLTKFERSAIQEKVWGEVHRTLQSDKSFSASLGRLWQQAEKANFDDASVKRVKDAWLARARTVAITSRNRLREEALGARSGESSKEDKDAGKKRTFPTKGGQARRQGKGVVDPKKINWAKTSDMDIINS